MFISKLIGDYNPRTYVQIIRKRFNHDILLLTPAFWVIYSTSPHWLSKVPRGRYQMSYLTIKKR